MYQKSNPELVTYTILNPDFTIENIKQQNSEEDKGEHVDFKNKIQ